MDNFGTIKTKLLHKLTESYENNDKKAIKEILNKIKKNKNYKSLYVFYENFEKQYFEDKGVAEKYVETISEMLKKENTLVSDIYSDFEPLIENVEVENEPLYENLDTLLSKDNILNIGDKIKAKNYLVEFLTTPKKDLTIDEETQNTDTIVENEKLLYAVLANNFNSKYDDILNENEKKELKEILNLSNDELKYNIDTIKEEIINNINGLLTENESNNMLTEKLNKTLDKVKNTPYTKYHYYKLKQLLDEN